jgi:SGNH domain (fused to AT3 domains)
MWWSSRARHSSKRRSRGYIDAWAALPASVKHVVVIRDEPYVTTRTPGCVVRAQARRRRPPGVACALARSVALGPDPAVLAARRLASPRVQVIDMARFMCDGRRCYPVVGGVLVHKDIGHLTRLFFTTLGPFVLRKLNRLMASWR